MSVLDRFRLDGRVALVTGGTKGLGRSMATGFVEAGAQVVVASRHAEEAAAVAQELAAHGGVRCAGYAADVTDPAQVEVLVSHVLADFGQVDILVNNAGVNIRGPIEELSVESFEVVQAINVRGPWLMCRALASHFKTRRYGRVINIGSMLSVVGMAERTPYATSKGALLQMTRTLALEWAPYGVTVNAMLPGPFATEMNQPILANPEVYQAFAARIPLGRWGELEEIQGLALFLASDAASFITGAAVAVDGGYTVW
ncbi:MAG: 2-deoxy-D-gluconate 3-dehydrogenase [Chloroflexota bacterium]|nr:glucose 1-dehydrogenase [Caldilinea sp.]GIK71827.1 MAG: 2-deoxy-D-gluconate 3-dehydrogenase [Chloroflexota bacterium]